MLPFTLANVRTLIDEYLTSHPDGVDVTAYVLTKLGKSSVEAHARAARLDLGAAAREIDATVRELLVRKHPAAEKLVQIPVRAERWPELAGWVTSYTAHRVPR
jgi:hypothetical protein